MTSTNILYTDTKLLSKDYLILELTSSLNKDLYEEKLISYNIFSKMQNLLIKKMNKIILNNREKQ